MVLIDASSGMKSRRGMEALVGDHRTGTAKTCTIAENDPR